MVDNTRQGWSEKQGLVWLGHISYMNLGKFDHDLTVLPNPGIMVRIRGIIPIWSYFRLVNYCNLPTKSCLSYCLMSWHPAVVRMHIVLCAGCSRAACTVRICQGWTFDCPSWTVWHSLPRQSLQRQALLGHAAHQICIHFCQSNIIVHYPTFVSWSFRAISQRLWIFVVCRLHLG